MKAWKKTLALMLALMMVLSMAACAGDSGAGSTTPSSSGTDTPASSTPSQPDNQDPGNEQPVTPPVSAGPAVDGFDNSKRYPLTTNTTLQVLFSEDGQGATDASALWEKVTGVKVDSLTWNSSKLENALMSGKGYDTAVMPGQLDKSTVYAAGADGKLLDFSQYLDKMPNLSKLIKQYPEIVSACRYPDGKMYSLPKVGWTSTSQGNLLYIRTDLLEEMGAEAPANADGFLQFIKDAQKKYGSSDPKFKAFMVQDKSYMDWYGVDTLCAAFFPTFGKLIETGLNVNAKGEVVLGAATEQFRYYVEFMYEVWKTGAFDTRAFTANNKTNIEEGHCAISIGTGYFEDGVAKVEVMQPITSRYMGKKQWLQAPVVDYYGCVANAAVAQDAEKLDVLLAWLDSFYATEDNPLNAEGTVYGYSIAMGELGVNWTKDDTNKTWESLTAFQSYSNALYSGNFQYIPVNNLRVKAEGTIEKLLPYAVPSFNLASTLALSPEDQDTVEVLWAGIDQYINDMHKKFITGVEETETGWEAYIEQLNRLGLEEILEIYQDAYDASLKQK